MFAHSLTRLFRWVVGVGLVGVIAIGSATSAMADSTQINWKGGPLTNATYTLNGGPTPTTDPTLNRTSPGGGNIPSPTPIAKVSGGLVMQDDPQGFKVPLCTNDNFVNGQGGIRTQGGGSHIAIVDPNKFWKEHQQLYEDVLHARRVQFGTDVVLVYNDPCGVEITLDTKLLPSNYQYVISLVEPFNVGNKDVAKPANFAAGPNVGYDASGDHKHSNLQYCTSNTALSYSNGDMVHSSSSSWEIVTNTDPTVNVTFNCAGVYRVNSEEVMPNGTVRSVGKQKITVRAQSAGQTAGHTAPSVSLSASPKTSQVKGSSFSLTAKALHIQYNSKYKDTVEIREVTAPHPNTLDGKPFVSWKAPGTFASYDFTQGVKSSFAQIVTYQAIVTEVGPNGTHTYPGNTVSVTWTKTKPSKKKKTPDAFVKPTVHLTVSPQAKEKVGYVFSLTAQTAKLRSGYRIAIREVHAVHPGTLDSKSSESWSSPGTFATFDFDASPESSSAQSVTYEAVITGTHDSKDFKVTSNQVTATWVKSTKSPTNGTPGGSTGGSSGGSGGSGGSRGSGGKNSTNPTNPTHPTNPSNPNSGTFGGSGSGATNPNNPSNPSHPNNPGGGQSGTVNQSGFGGSSSSSNTGGIHNGPIVITK